MTSANPVGEIDLHLFNEGTHRHLHDCLGAHTDDTGTWFAVWAPNAASVDVPGDFPGKGIKSVPRIVMKPTEEARGQPLVGAEAKITDGFFWIALSAADADISANLALLRERDWIDLPFVYETGQRAILTFEKGTQGDQVFQKAMTAWTSTAG